MRNRVSYDLIYKRSKCLMSDCNFNDVGFRLKNLDSDKSKEKFFNECCCSDNANTYYKECLDIIANESSDLKQLKMTKRFGDDILPYVENLSYVEHYLSSIRENVSPKAMNLLSDKIKKYSKCDIILKNHSTICEQYDVDAMTEANRNKNVKYISRDISRIVTKEADALSRCQQMDVCLDEVSYLLHKHAIPYNGKALVRSITEYFLMLPNNTENDIRAYKNVLFSNESVRDMDLGTVSYFLELVDTTTSQIILNLNRFKTSLDKDIYSFCDFIADLPTPKYDKQDFLNHFGRVLLFIQDFLLDEYYNDSIITALDKVPEYIEEQMHMNEFAYTREELDQLVQFYENAIETIDTELADIPDSNRANYLVRLKASHRKAISALNVMRGITYPKEALSNMREFALLVEDSHPYYLNEFKLFKFNNLLKAAAEAEKFIKTKGKILMDKISGKLIFKKRIKKFSEVTVYECLTESDTCDICVGSFQIIDKQSMYQIHDIMTEMCNQINKNIIPLVNRDLVKSYYIANEDVVEIHIEDASTIFVDGSDINEINENLYFDEEFKVRCLELQEMANTLESIDIDFMTNIVSYTESKMNKISTDAMCCVIETMGYVDNVNKSDVEYLGKLYMESHDDGYKVKRSIDNFRSLCLETEVPLEVQSEACNIISSLLESEEEKKDINKKKEEKTEEEKNNNDKKTLGQKIKEKHQEFKDKREEEKKEKEENPQSGAGLNSLKLFMKGLQAKMKDMGNKEKEFCKNLDMNFNRLYKGCKDALVSDRREAIIRGSIIPSFSKSIKLGIGLAGITALNPVAGAAAAIGGVAMSKHLTKKERLLLLDEIDTELEVLEEEISSAKSKGNTKKLRKLLQYKKDLQRQYQRIKYNIRIGKDLLPGSTTGLKERD